jgi:hypothetical protein
VVALHIYTHAVGVGGGDSALTTRTKLLFSFLSIHRTIDHNFHGGQGLRRAQGLRVRAGAAVPAVLRGGRGSDPPGPLHRARRVAGAAPPQAAVLPAGPVGAVPERDAAGVHVPVHDDAGDGGGAQPERARGRVLRPGGRVRGVQGRGDHGADAAARAVPGAPGRVRVVPVPARPGRRRAAPAAAGRGAGAGRDGGLRARRRPRRRLGPLEGRHQLDLGTLPPPRQLPRAAHRQRRQGQLRRQHRRRHRILPLPAGSGLRRRRLAVLSLSLYQLAVFANSSIESKDDASFVGVHHSRTSSYLLSATADFSSGWLVGWLVD